MATRNSYTSASPAFTGANLVDDQASKNDVFFNNISLIPTVITNTGNDYTLTIDPVLKTGTDVTANMSFVLIPNAANTDNVRARITASNPYYTVKKSDGTDLIAGEFNTQTAYQLVFISGGFRIMNTLSSQALSGLINEQKFNASGTWTKPLNMPSTALVEVWIWGGGGGGGNGGATAGGGGGGGCAIERFKISELGATETVTIGAGGAAGSAGGNSTFGSLVAAYGGGASTGAANGGGGGGGVTSAGATASTSAGALGGGGAGGGNNGFAGGATSGIGRCGAGGGGNGSNGAGGDAIFGGGGGAGGSGANSGGASYYGGAGGSSGGNVITTSIYGGSGGNNGTAPTAPGGGGAGTNAGGGVSTGAIGKCIVRIIV